LQAQHFPLVRIVNEIPKELASIFLILFLLASGIGQFVLGALLCQAAAVFPIVAVDIYLLGKSLELLCTRQPPRFGEAFYY